VCDKLVFLKITTPTLKTIIPRITICIPYVIQFRFEYMNDDSGPMIECPWRWKIMPKITIMVPIVTSAFPPFIEFSLFSSKKGKQN